MSHSTSAPAPAPSGRGRTQRAGALDIRVVIAALLGLYGLILTVMGIFTTDDADLAKTDGVNANLWTGIGLLVVAGLFALWARLRPTLVPAEDAAAAAQESSGHGVGEPGASRRTSGTGGAEA